MAKGNELPSAMALDEAGDIYVVGTFDGAFAFGSGPTITPTGPFDAFIVKLSGDDGSHIWTQDWGEESVSTGPRDIAVDVTGAPSVVGNTVSPPGCIICSFDAFVRRFEPSGVPDWEIASTGAGNQTAEALAVDGTGNLWVGGSFEQTLDFGSPTDATDGSDAYLTKLDALGAHDFTLTYGDSPSEGVTDIALDSQGGPVLVGTFTDTINFGGADLASAGLRDYFVARLDAGGNLVFANRYGDETDQTVLRLALDADDNVLLAGALRGGATFAGVTLDSNGGDDAFIVKIDDAGFFKWGKHFGDEANQATLTVASGLHGAVLIGGRALGDIDFGDGVQSATAPSQDAFVASFWP